MKFKLSHQPFLRALAVFLTVFFTVGWGIDSPPEYDEYLIIFAVILAISLAFLKV